MLDHTGTGGIKDNSVVVEEALVIISNAASKRQKLELKVRLCVCLFLFSCVCTSLLYVDSAAKYFIGIGLSIFLLFGISFFLGLCCLLSLNVYSSMISMVKVSNPVTSRGQ